ncbi:MAG: M6 family metalloprotease domain-containing protein [Prevotellaceae bacterium]|nr:M6 family metalloprotease domain-containing protein [Prevotellaceae bacterium]
MNKNLLVLSASLLLALPMSAQQNDDDYIIPVQPKRCGTSILLEQQRQAAKANGMKKVVSSTANYVPHTGSINIPVILVNFKDVKFTINDPKALFNEFFNAEQLDSLGNGLTKNHGSVRQYFSDMSGGNFTPNFKVYGPVTVDQDETYYGGSNAYGSDENASALVTDAIAKLQNSPDSITSAELNNFCSDGKTVDCVYIVYAGKGQNFGGANTTIWAKTGNYSGTLGGKTVRWYSMAGELTPTNLDAKGNFSSTGTIPCITGIGVTCHEFSHAMGLPDFYPFSNASARIDNQEMEMWDLMDGGEYSTNGFCPTAFTTWERNQMGWPVTITTLDDNASITMEKSSLASGQAYKIVNPDNSNEYMMLEHIHRSGWNSGLRGSGLMVYHVCEPGGALTMGSDYNGTKGFPGMAIVPADSICASSYSTTGNYITTHTEKVNKLPPYTAQLYGDLFPGTYSVIDKDMNVTELSDTKIKPNWCWYNTAKTQKLATNKALTNIAFDKTTGVLTFNYVSDVTAIRTINNDVKTTGRIYDLSGRYVGSNLSTLPHGIYVKDGQKIIK